MTLIFETCLQTDFYDWQIAVREQIFRFFDAAIRDTAAAALARLPVAIEFE